MLLWAGRGRTGQVSSVQCQVQVSASQGREELALGRCWVIFLPQPPHFSHAGQSREDKSPPHVPWERSDHSSRKSETRRV